MMKKMFRLLPLYLSLFASVSLYAQYAMNHKLAMAYFAVSTLYVDSIDPNKLAEDAIVGMLEKLDPHSEYMTKEMVSQMNEPLQGNFDGIGVQFNMIKDTLFVIQTIPGGPSEKLGVLAGDRIIEANDTIIAGVKMKNTHIMKILRGKKGTTVRIKVIRKGVSEPLMFNIKRDKIPIYSLDASYMIRPTIGYIKLNRFSATTYEEYLKALSHLKKRGMRSLILDLQGNGGGYLTAAINLADDFLSNGQRIVYTEGNHSPKEEAVATAKGSFEQGQLVVLVDESSASAAEIVSGAIQDWDRGVVVGRRTFGKGLVQRPIPLSDGSMIKLTVSRYYTPTGRCIQKPYQGGRVDYMNELTKRFEHGELIHKDSIHFPDSLKMRTLQNRRTVYGGGGIMPDIFVSLDTTRYTGYHRKLLASGSLHRYCYQLLDKQRGSLLKQFSTFEQYNKDFNLETTSMQELLAIAAEEKVAYVEDQFLLSKALIALQIKALLARDIWGTTEYFRVINVENESVVRAIELLENGALYSQILAPDVE